MTKPILGEFTDFRVKSSLCDMQALQGVGKFRHTSSMDSSCCFGAGLCIIVPFHHGQERSWLFAWAGHVDRSCACTGNQNPCDDLSQRFLLPPLTASQSPHDTKAYKNALPLLLIACEHDLIEYIILF